MKIRRKNRKAQIIQEWKWKCEMKMCLLLCLKLCNKKRRGERREEREERARKSKAFPSSLNLYWKETSLSYTSSLSSFQFPPFFSLLPLEFLSLSLTTDFVSDVQSCGSWLRKVSSLRDIILLPSLIIFLGRDIACKNDSKWQNQGRHISFC